MDRLLKMQGKKIVKQRLDFPFQKTLKMTDKLPTMQGKVNKVLKQRLDYPFHTRNKTTERLLTM